MGGEKTLTLVYMSMWRPINILDALISWPIIKVDSKLAADAALLMFVSLSRHRLSG